MFPLALPDSALGCAPPVLGCHNRRCVSARTRGVRGFGSSRLHYGRPGCNRAGFGSRITNLSGFPALWGVQGVQGLSVGVEVLRRSLRRSPSGFESQESQA
jgi:hypothetical protein